MKFLLGITSKSTLNDAMILDTFDGAFLINRDEDEERLEQATRELERVGIVADRLSAIEPQDAGAHRSPGARGCLLAHYRAVVYAEARGYSSVLIMEDDLVFRHDFNSYWDKLKEEINRTEWDILYGYDWENGNQWSPPEQFALRRLDENTCCHFWAIHSRFYDRFLGKISCNETKNRGIGLDSTFVGPDIRQCAPNYNLVGQRVNESTTASRWQAQALSAYEGVYWHGK